jgi:hypothetical protein
MINFYLITAAFLTAGYATSAGAGKYSVAAVVALGGVLVSLVFNAFDSRTRELLQAAEPALMRLQEILGSTGLAEVDFVARTCAPVRRAPSYRVCVNILTVAGTIAFIGGFLHALLSL